MYITHSIDKDTYLSQVQTPEECFMPNQMLVIAMCCSREKKEGGKKGINSEDIN